MEHYLVSDGYALDALRGYTETVETTDPRTDIAASLGRVDASLVRPAQVGSIALGTLVAVETGLLSSVVLSLCVVVVLEQVRRLDAPGPVTKTHNVRRPGMTETEVYRRLTMSNEIAELKKEEQEKARRKAKRKRGGP